jgi:hypothetical protein
MPWWGGSESLPAAWCGDQAESSQIWLVKETPSNGDANRSDFHRGRTVARRVQKMERGLSQQLPSDFDE